jgi:DNA polymerase elongation subunit (family B)
MEEIVTVQQLKNIPNISEYEVWDEDLGVWVDAASSKYTYTGPTGFAGPTNPYAEINAVTVYQSWTGKFLTAVIPPSGTHPTTAELYSKIDELIAAGQMRADSRPEILICRDEHQLLTFMCNAISEADIISGWNSEFYDIPYICERLLLVGGPRMLQKIEHLGVRPPRKEMVNRFGSEEPIYKFTGRCHLDYMRLFQKFTFEGRVSYALGNILQEEVGMGKLEYEGTLEQLYKNDFATFTSYNLRDVDGLVQLDEKFKFIALANQMAHENTVHFDAVLGTVSYVETGITNHAHYKLNKIVHDKTIKEHDKVEGAIVLTPKIGLHEWVGSVDIESLYPSVARSLNLSPETMRGQFMNYIDEEDWEKIINQSDDECTVIWTDGTQETRSGRDWNNFLRTNGMALSAYGTIFDQKTPGVFSDMLTHWFSERKKLKAEKNKWSDEVVRLKKELGFTLPDNF